LINLGYFGFALVCGGYCLILMGAGIADYATYIILASIVAPAVDDFGCILMASHFFIFYYGCLADCTPPLRWRLYSGAGIAAF